MSNILFSQLPSKSNRSSFKQPPNATLVQTFANDSNGGSSGGWNVEDEWDVLKSASATCEALSSSVRIEIGGLGYISNKVKYWHDNSYLVFEFDGQIEVWEVDHTWTGSTQKVTGVYGRQSSFTVSLDNKTKLYKISMTITTDKCEYSRQLNLYYATPKQA